MILYSIYKATSHINHRKKQIIEKLEKMRKISGLITEPYQFYHPFRMLISGSSGTGKTTFCENLLESEMIQKFKNIYYVYPEELDTPPGFIISYFPKFISNFSRLGR